MTGHLLDVTVIREVAVSEIPMDGQRSLQPLTKDDSALDLPARLCPRRITETPGCRSAVESPGECAVRNPLLIEGADRSPAAPSHTNAIVRLKEATEGTGVPE